MKIEQFLAGKGAFSEPEAEADAAIINDPAPDSDMGRAIPCKTEVGIYPTSDYQKLMGWCAYIFKHRKIGAMVGYPGSGKTTILRAYCGTNPGAHYIECWSSMRMGDLLEMIGEAVGTQLKGSTYHKEQQLMEALRGRTDVMRSLMKANT